MCTFILCAGRFYNSSCLEETLLNTSHDTCCSTCFHLSQCEIMAECCGLSASVRSRHCGMDTCSYLSLGSQHMCGWAAPGIIAIWGAIDSNPSFLLGYKPLILQHAGGHVFTTEDLWSWHTNGQSVGAHVVYHYQLSTAFHGGLRGLLEKATKTYSQTKHQEVH